MDADPVELRVLGCLIEKQRTTPDAYPLSLNALRLACNQSTNRDPVVDYDEADIRDALQRLYRRRWTRLTSGQSSRTAKYRHLLDEALGLREDELALLAILMLRGAQTPGELNQRAARLHAFGSLAAIQDALDRLIRRDFVARLERRPGQKEERYMQLLGGGEEAEMAAPRAAAAPTATVRTIAANADADAAPAADAGTDPAAASLAVPPSEPVSVAAAPDLAGVGALRDEIATLRDEIAILRAEVAGLREALGG